jgi:hypothetical protein
MEITRMTKEEIIELVMQIGGCDRPEENSPALKMFVTFAKLVAEHEREACAKEVENALYGQEGCGKAANAIRARGQE